MISVLSVAGLDGTEQGTAAEPVRALSEAVS